MESGGAGGLPARGRGDEVFGVPRSPGKGSSEGCLVSKYTNNIYFSCEPLPTEWGPPHRIMLLV